MGWQTQAVVQLIAGNTIINPNGDFVYSPSIGAGNLIASIAPTAGTDQFGNTYTQGFESQSNGIKAIMFQGLLELTWVAGAGGLGGPGPSQPCLVEVAIPASNSNSPVLEITGPSSFPSDNAFPVLNMFGKSQDGTATNKIVIQNADGSSLPVNLIAGGGPFVNGETWHNISLAGNFTGTFRVKKQPWNTVRVNGALTWSGTGPTTATFGTMPDSSYLPVSDIRHPIAHTGIPTSLQSGPRVFVPAAGTGLQLIMPQVTAANSSIGFDFEFPTD